MTKSRSELAMIAMKRVEAEIFRAVVKFPPFNSPHEGYAIILEELEELWADVMANRKKEAIAEAVQVAAMAVRFIMDLDTDI